jgi:NTP pyrophosphatase (non-canonical NTP hydrolase)
MTDDTSSSHALPLDFDELRKANVARMAVYKNARGNPAHTATDGSDWALSAWSNATLGELGETANIIKKIERGDFTLEDVREQLAEELADVQIYLDILAFRCGVDLGKATRDKFNKVSKRIGSDIEL